MKRIGLLAGLGLGVVIACGSSDDDSGSTSQALPTATNAFCVTPSASPQDVPLPNTGGVTGTLSFAAYPSGTAGGCDAVRISTGADVEGGTGTSSSPLHVESNPANPAPILTVSVGEGLNGNPIFGDEAIITSLTLNLPPNLNFADGTYYMTVSNPGTDGVAKVSLVELTAKGGVLTVAPQTNPLNGSSFPVVILASTSAVLSLYARGVIPNVNVPNTPDTGADGGTPTVNIADAGLPPLGDPPDHAPAMAGFQGLPPPNAGAKIGYVKSVKDSTCTSNCSTQQEIDSNGGEPTALYTYSHVGETVTYEANIAYMQLRYASNNCPTDWDITAGLDGTGIITIPASDPFFAQDCSITYSTVTPNTEGGSYSFTLHLMGLPAH